MNKHDFFDSIKNDENENIVNAIENDSNNTDFFIKTMASYSDVKFNTNCLDKYDSQTSNGIKPQFDDIFGELSNKVIDDNIKNTDSDDKSEEIIKRLDKYYTHKDTFEQFNKFKDSLSKVTSGDINTNDIIDVIKTYKDFINKGFTIH